MLQVFRLVKPGKVDQILAFDELPKRLLTGIRKLDESKTRGLREWLKEKGCLEKRITKHMVAKDTFETVEVVFPFSYVLEYTAINQDKEKWQEIVNYIRRVVSPDFRLMDKIEDMAVPMAADCTSEITLEPEMIPVIPIIQPLTQSAASDDPVVLAIEEQTDKELVVELKKRRGRPKKIAEELIHAK